MMKVLLSIVMTFFSSVLFSQSNLKQFKKLSRPEKCWVFMHPFKAKKAFTITKMVLSDVDSIKRSGVIGTDLNGGKLDAFKHAYWMLSLTYEIGKRRALKLGKAHERGNYLEYKKHKLEDNILPDSVSSEMDLRNNNSGAGAKGYCFMFNGKEDLQRISMNLLTEGKLTIIKKDKQGNYLYCDGTFIDTNEWKGKWNIPKCLVSSNTD